MSLTMLSLFAGIGGSDLAAEACGIETVGFVEWNPYCQAVLHKHWPDVPIWGDICDFSKEVFDGRKGTVVVADSYGSVASDGGECQTAEGEGLGRRDDRGRSDSDAGKVSDECPGQDTSMDGEGEDGRKGIVADSDSTVLGTSECGVDGEGETADEGWDRRTLDESGRCGTPLSDAEHDGRLTAEAAVEHHPLQSEGSPRQEVPQHEPQGERGVRCVGSGRSTVDIISGGFPCQPFSTAGKQRGWSDSRALWPQMLRVIEEFRPTWVVGENVAGFVAMGLDRALSDLEAEGYEATAFVFSALSVGAPHLRDRVFIVAHSNGEGLQGGQQQGEYPEEPGRWQGGLPGAVAECGNDVAHSGCEPERSSEGRPRSERDDRPEEGVGTKEGNGLGDGGCRKREGRADDPTEPGLGRVAHGLSAWMDRLCGLSLWEGDWEGETPRVASKIPNRVHRIKAIGNACVPAQIYPIFRCIADLEDVAEAMAA